MLLWMLNVRGNAAVMSLGRTHGSEVSIEWPDRVYDGGPDTPLDHPRRAGWGTEVRQLPDSTNWFHFSIPALCGNAYLSRAWVSFKVNPTAKIDRMDLHAGKRRIALYDELEGLQGREDIYALYQQYPLLIKDVEAISMSVHVRFLPGNQLGHVTFYGAGADTE
jgi:hypothetical protein